MNGNIINNAQFVPEEFWTCVCPDDVLVRCPLLMFHSVTATDTGGMSTFITDCPGCNHMGCEYCPIEVVNIRADQTS